MSADAKSQTADSSPSAAKKNIPFIIALVAGLGAGGAMGAFLVGPAMASGIAPAMAATAAHKAAKKAHASAEEEDEDTGGDEAADDEEGGDEEEASAEGGSSHGEKGGEKGAGKEVYTLDNLVLNPAESGGTRFLLLSIAFEAPNAAVLESMKARDAELRDAVLLLLGSKTVEQLSDMKTRETIKTELKASAVKLLGKKAKRLRVYFPQFVIQ